MGLWMIQSVRHEYDDKYGFAEICQMAEEAKDFPSRVDENTPTFAFVFTNIVVPPV